jgi:hypothetical protein
MLLIACCGTKELRDIIIRALQIRSPRVAGALTLAGLIVPRLEDTAPRAAVFRFAWDQLNAVLR